MIMCVLLCYPVSIRIYYQQGGLFLVLIWIFIKFLEFLWEFEFCGKASVLTMSSQDEFKTKGQRKRLL